MRSYYKTLFTAAALTLALLVCIPAAAQGPSDLTVQDQTPSAPAPQTAAPADDDGWHFAISPYLWFPGMSGTTGALGHNVAVHASPGEVLSHFHIGLMGNVEARKGHFVMPFDFIWVKLQADRGLPEELDLNSIQLKVTEAIFTPKVGYRIVDHEKVKIDALIGLRYWHLGESLNFQPQIFNGISTSQNWVDGVAGMKFEFALSPKVVLTVAGDAGGGGAAVDYQALGVLGFRICRICILDLGYRYLDTNYRTNPPGLFVFDAHMSGALLGVTFNLK
jgi:hypothetical protein